MKNVYAVTLFLSVFLLGSGPLQAAARETATEKGKKKSDRKQASTRQEEQGDYFQKWLEEDVKYIITDEEKNIFRKLTTTEEKEQFIEQFWSRRDPDPRTTLNEFKEEHYRRIVYANDHFGSGFAGWMTDRGRVYIIQGPPAEIERHPSGGGYDRPIYEGGGATATYPFEVWRYRHINDLGDDVELEFVDKTWTGDYRLALTADEKDALLNAPGMGMTKAEQIGLATKFQRMQLRMSGANREIYPLMQHRAKDSIFARYETFAKVRAPATLKYRDLREAVQIKIRYQDFPFTVRQDYFRLNDRQVLVPVTLEFQNKNLTFELENGVQRAKIAVYGIVSSLTNKVVTEFEDDLVTSFQPQDLERGLKGKTLYQKLLVLDAGMRHKVSLVAKDIGGGNMGVVDRGLAPPRFPSGQMALSSLVLADFIEQLGSVPATRQMFVLGDVKVRPATDKTFPRDGALGLYLQLYNAALDQSSLQPDLDVTYRVRQNGKTVLELVDESNRSLHIYSEKRIALIKGISLKGLEAGEYRVEVEIRDRVGNEVVTANDGFRIAESS
ncbi:MAG: GWxTD domain-containing protein [Acidobacteriota bacterium]